jgi:four helix bundle protein
MEGYRGLKVYDLVYQAAMEIFTLSGSFPKEEKYALTDQIRRSSRSVVANLAEGYRKKRYPKLYMSKLIEVDGEIAETLVWIDFAHSCCYINASQHRLVTARYNEAGRMIQGIISSIQL